MTNDEMMRTEIWASVPEELRNALDGSPEARALFLAMPPSHRRE